MEEGRSAFIILTGKPAGKRPLGNSRRRWEDNIIMDLKEIFIIMGNWADLAQERDYWTALVITALDLVSVSHGVRFIYIGIYWYMLSKSTESKIPINTS
jgi:hypothetical protein